MLGRNNTQTASTGPTVRRPISAGGRAKPAIVVAIIVAVIAAWLLFVVLVGQMGGAEQASGGADPSASSQQQSESPSGGGGSDDSGTAPDNTDSSGGGDDDSVTIDAGSEGSSPDYDSSDDASGDRGSADNENVSYEGSGSSQEDLAPYAAPPSGPGGPEGDPGALNDTGQTRARAAAEQFVSAAYGYTGTSNDDYLEGIEQVAGDDIYSSPGGERLKDYANAAPECGMRSTAVLDDFEIVQTAPEGVAATAYFTVNDGGTEHTFKQNQILQATDEGNYQIIGVAVEELTSDTQPTETCPGNIPGEPNPRSSDTGPETGPTEDLPPEQAAAIEETVRRHYDAIGSGDFETAYSYFGPTYTSLVPQDAWVQSHVAEGVESSEISSVEVGRDTVGTPTADVTVSFTDDAGEHTFEIVWALLKDGDSYKLDVQTYGHKTGSTTGGDG